MYFTSTQERDQFVEDVVSCLSTSYQDTEGRQVTAVPETVLMQEMRGMRMPGGRGRGRVHPELKSGRTWILRGGPNGFNNAVREAGFRTIKGHRVEPRRGAQCTLIVRG